MSRWVVLYKVAGANLKKWDLRPMFYHVANGLEFQGTESIFARQLRKQL